MKKLPIFLLASSTLLFAGCGIFKPTPDPKTSPKSTAATIQLSPTLIEYNNKEQPHAWSQGAKTLKAQLEDPKATSYLDRKTIAEGSVSDEGKTNILLPLQVDQLYQQKLTEIDGFKLLKGHEDCDISDIKAVNLDKTNINVIRWNFGRQVYDLLEYQLPVIKRPANDEASLDENESKLSELRKYIMYVYLSGPLKVEGKLICNDYFSADTFHYNLSLTKGLNVIKIASKSTLNDSKVNGDGKYNTNHYIENSQQINFDTWYFMSDSHEDHHVHEND